MPRHSLAWTILALVGVVHAGDALSTLDAFPGATDRGVPIPSNGSDACSGAPTIAGYGTWSFDFAGATTDGVAHDPCSPIGSDQIYRDRWWLWTAPAYGIVRIETCGQTISDTMIAAYSVNSPCIPGDEYLLTCNDDACGAQTAVEFAAQAGQTYRVRIGRYGTPEPPASGSGTFTISGPATPDLCPDDATQCQPPVPDGAGYGSHTTARVADDVLLTDAGDLGGLCWWGSYAAPAPGADSFVVTYWSQSATDAPALQLARFAQSEGALAVQRAGAGLVNNVGGTVFLYSARHAGVQVAAGSTIWVEVRNMFGGVWFWQQSHPGDGSLQDTTPATGWTGSVPRPDMAFCLQQSASGCALDTNGDGVINFADLNNIVSSFNTACP